MLLKTSHSRRSLFGFTLILLLAGFIALNQSTWSSMTLHAQDSETLDDPLAESVGADPVDDAGESSTGKSKSSGNKRSLLTMIFSGDPLGIAIVFLIIILSFVSAFFILEHMITITKNKLMPERVITELEQHIARGEITQAAEFCHQPENYCLVSEVILAGLDRFQASEFGFAEYKSAVEEAGEDHTGRLYRKTEVLGVIGSIAPMLGLTGTVLGMITAFNTIAEKEGMARPEELAGGIGQALITTLLGLLVAIPTMVAFSYFRNKIDSIVAEAGKRVERVMMPLGRKR